MSHKELLVKTVVVTVSIILLAAPGVLAQNTCDVNNDGQVTPLDALCPFEEYLDIGCEHCSSSPACEGTLSPLGRWCDQQNGTVKDMTTGLVWLKNAGYYVPRQWDVPVGSDEIDAHEQAAGIWDGHYGPPDLSDGSVEGDWRLPTKNELVGIITGDEYIRGSSPYFFDNVQSFSYWSSTTGASNQLGAWLVSMLSGYVGYGSKTSYFYVWPVRGSID